VRTTSSWGRDHAGPGNGSDGKPFFGPYDAQEALAAHAEEIGVTMVPFREMVYLPDEDRYEESDRVPKGVRTLSISGTQVRNEYLAKGRKLPAWFTRPETGGDPAADLAAPARAGFLRLVHRALGSGKSTTAEILADLLSSGPPGDPPRRRRRPDALSKGLGFSREDRDTNIRRIGFVASEIVRHNGVAVCAAISPYRLTRAECRAMSGDGQFPRGLRRYADRGLRVAATRKGCTPRRAPES